jgi:hypothetical protein
MGPSLHTTAGVRAPRLRGRLRSLALVAAGVGLALGGSFLIGGDEQRGDGLRVYEGPSGSPYSVRYPASWQPLSKDELGLLAGSPAGALRRKDRSGFVVIRQEKGRAGGDLNEFADKLVSHLKKQVPDFKGKSAKLIKTRAGKAFYVSYIRKRKGTLHSLVVVPAGSKTYTLNTVSSGRAPEAARETGRIIVSFDS